ncbi:hypothetical protein DL96DRAFT_1704580 [Flagelloscypha sp. PMI_526]|nr:hypothetical protein DL96DRAFT_1704580 [Flagelloscypha sp. PMI_526]
MRTTRASAATAPAPAPAPVTRKRKQPPSEPLPEPPKPARRSSRRSTPTAKVAESAAEEPPARKKRKSDASSSSSSASASGSTTSSAGTSQKVAPSTPTQRKTRAAKKAVMAAVGNQTEQASGIMPLSVVDVGPVKGSADSRPRSPTPTLTLTIPGSSSPPQDSNSPPPSPGSSAAGSPPLLPTVPLLSPSPVSPISLPVSSLPIPQPPPLQLEPVPTSSQPTLGGEPDAEGEIDETLVDLNFALGLPILTTPPPQPEFEDPADRVLNKSTVPKFNSPLAITFTADGSLDTTHLEAHIRRRDPNHRGPHSSAPAHSGSDPDYRSNKYNLFEMASRVRMQTTRRNCGIEIKGLPYKSLDPIRRLEEENCDKYWNKYGWPLDLPDRQGSGLLSRSPFSRSRSLTPMPSPPRQTPPPPPPPSSASSSSPKRRKLNNESVAETPEPRFTRSKTKAIVKEEKGKGKAIPQPPPPPSPGRVTRATSDKKRQVIPLPAGRRRRSSRLHHDDVDEEQVVQDLLTISTSSSTSEKRKASWLDDDSSLSELSDSDKEEDDSKVSSDVKEVHGEEEEEEDDSEEDEEDFDAPLTPAQQEEFEMLSSAEFINPGLSGPATPPAGPSPPSESLLFLPIEKPLQPVMGVVSPKALEVPSLARPEIPSLRDIKVPGLITFDLPPGKNQLGTPLDNRRRRVWAGREMPEPPYSGPYPVENFKTGVLRQRPRTTKLEYTPLGYLAEYYPEHCPIAPPGYYERKKREREEAARIQAEQELQAQLQQQGGQQQQAHDLHMQSLYSPGSSAYSSGFDSATPEVHTPSWENFELNPDAPLVPPNPNTEHYTNLFNGMFGEGTSTNPLGTADPGLAGYGFSSASHHDYTNHPAHTLAPGQWAADVGVSGNNALGFDFGFNSPQNPWGGAPSTGYGGSNDGMFGTFNNNTVGVVPDASWFTAPLPSTSGGQGTSNMWDLGNYGGAGPSSTGGVNVSDPQQQFNSGNDSQLNLALGGFA